MQIFMLITYRQHTTAVNTYILKYNKGDRNTGTYIYISKIINLEYHAGG